jgi:DtxR family transcriptional regulator, Mn-dependent transcriptional regulator
VNPTTRRQKAREPTATNEKYLKAIYILGLDGDRLTGARLARWMGVSTPTVSTIIARLVRDELVLPDMRSIRLTQQGLKSAEGVLRRHHILERWLMEALGLGWARVHAEACMLEYALSPAVVERMAAMLGSCETCPHGNQLPDRRVASSQPVIPLAHAAVGCEIMLEGIAEPAEDDSQLLEHLYREGLLPGVTLRVVAVCSSVGTLTVAHTTRSPHDGGMPSKGSARTSVLGLEAASKLTVRVLRAGTSGPPKAEGTRAPVGERIQT